MYYAHMRPFASSRRQSAEPTNVFFLSFAGTPIKNIGMKHAIWTPLSTVY